MSTVRKPPIADIDEDPNVELRPFSSPPCYAHEVDPAYFGFPDAGGTADAGALRRALRDAETAIAALSRVLDRL
jgi:hypothetical protein